jgi:hypothetical protein
MSSLWTPDGEHRVQQPGEAPDPDARAARDDDAAPPSSPPSHPPDTSLGVPDDEDLDQPSEAELREMARQLARAPVEDVVANHCYGLFELAALHLSQQPPQLVQARIAIDAMGLLVDGLGDRLGGHAAGLREGVTQVRLAFVRIAEAAGAAAGGGTPGAASESHDQAAAGAASDESADPPTQVDSGDPADQGDPAGPAAEDEPTDEPDDHRAGHPRQPGAD